MVAKQVFRTHQLLLCLLDPTLLTLIAHVMHTGCQLMPNLGCCQLEALSVIPNVIHETQVGHPAKSIEPYTEISSPCKERGAVRCHAQVPLQLAIRETSDAGTPIVAHQPDSPAAQAYQHISSLIYEKLQQTPTQLQPPLLGHASGVIV